MSVPSSVLCDLSLTSGCLAGRMGDAVTAATPALDCSSDEIYEPLVGLRLAAMFGILAVSSFGGEDIAFLDAMSKCATCKVSNGKADTLLSSCSVLALADLHCEAEQHLLFGESIRLRCGHCHWLRSCPWGCHSIAQRSLLRLVDHIPMGLGICKLFFNACLHL